MIRVGQGEGVLQEIADIARQDFTSVTATESGMPVTLVAVGQILQECTTQLIGPNLVGHEIQGRHPSRRCDIGSENHSKVLVEEKQSAETKPVRCWSGPGR